MLVFFAVIGASAGGLQQLPTCWAMMGFLTIMVVVHWVVLAAGGTLLGLSREAMLLGSNANIGGPATSASECQHHIPFWCLFSPAACCRTFLGMAMSKGWGASMAQTAMLVGSLGYAVGTAAGMVVAKVTSMIR